MAPPITLFLTTIASQPALRSRQEYLLRTLQVKKIKFSAYDLASDEQARKLWKRKAPPGKQDLPGYLVGNQFIGTVADLERAVESNQLSQFLRLNDEWDDEVEGMYAGAQPKVQPVGVPGAYKPSEMTGHQPSFNKSGKPTERYVEHKEGVIDMGKELPGMGLENVKVTEDELLQLVDELGLDDKDAAALLPGAKTKLRPQKEVASPVKVKSEESSTKRPATPEKRQSIPKAPLPIPDTLTRKDPDVVAEPPTTTPVLPKPTVVSPIVTGPTSPRKESPTVPKPTPEPLPEPVPELSTPVAEKAEVPTTSPSSKSAPVKDVVLPAAETPATVEEAATEPVVAPAVTPSEKPIPAEDEVEPAKRSLQVERTPRKPTLVKKPETPAEEARPTLVQPTVAGEPDEASHYADLFAEFETDAQVQLDMILDYKPEAIQDEKPPRLTVDIEPEARSSITSPAEPPKKEETLPTSPPSVHKVPASSPNAGSPAAIEPLRLGKKRQPAVDSPSPVQRSAAASTTPSRKKTASRSTNPPPPKIEERTSSDWIVLSTSADGSEPADEFSQVPPLSFPPTAPLRLSPSNVPSLSWKPTAILPSKRRTKKGGHTSTIMTPVDYETAPGRNAMEGERPDDLDFQR